MAAPRSRRTVVLLSAAGTLAPLDRRLARSRVRLRRVVVTEAAPVSPRRWLPRLLARRPPDGVVVTSPAGVAAGVRPWLRSAGREAAELEYWAAGPVTARALRSAGVRRVHRAPGLGARAVAEALRRGPRRRLLYFRSDRAGPELARRLRRNGHRVTEAVVYRLGRSRPPSASTFAAIRDADLVVAASPSAIDALARAAGSARLRPLARSTALVVLGERSRAAARAHGFRRVSVAPSPNPERFTRHLLRELEHAGS